MTSVRPCPACGRRTQTAGDLRRCVACGTLDGGADEPTGRAYAEPPARRFGAPVRAALALGYRERLRSLGPIAAGARVLDVGAGDGGFAAVLAGAGYDVTALEPFRHAVPTAGVHVVQGTLADAELPDAAWDLAVLWHVLEHLPEPLEALWRVRRAVVPGGRIAVAVPNVASLQAAIGGERWFHLDRERHRVHFTPAGLTALLGRAGLEVEGIRASHLDQALPGMWMTLLNLLPGRRDALRDIVRRRATPSAAIAILAAPVLLPVAVAAELAAAVAGRAGAIVATARIPA